MEKPMLKIRWEEDQAIVSLCCERIYQNEIPDFRAELLTLLKEEDRFILDLSPVEVMNSTALGVLLLAQEQVAASGGIMVLTGLNPVLQQLFTQMKLGILLTVAKTEEEARRLCRSGR